MDWQAANSRAGGASIMTMVEDAREIRNKVADFMVCDCEVVYM